MNPVDVLRGQIQTAVDGVKPGGGLKRWVCCAECQQAIELDSTVLPPPKCPSCGKEDPRWGSGVSKETAESRALLMKGQSAAPSAGASTPASSEPAGTSSTPAGSSSPGESTGAASGAASTSSGAPSQKKTRSQRKAAPPPTTPPTTQDVTPTSGLEMDWAEKRRLAVAALIEKSQLNKVQPTEVGTAVVSTFGYTIWQDGLPVYRFMEPSDTPKSFKEEFLLDKSEFPGIEMDVVRCHSMDNPDVVACCFKGNLVASTNNGRGNVRVMSGAKVRIGALATDKSVRFVVLY